MNFPAVLMGILATYRISRMLAIEDGPFDLFIIFRTAIANWIDSHDKWILSATDHWLYRGFSCPLCLSFWCGFIIAAFLPFSSLQEYFVLSVALSGGASFLYKMERNDE